MTEDAKKTSKKLEVRNLTAVPTVVGSPTFTAPALGVVHNLQPVSTVVQGVPGRYKHGDNLAQATARAFLYDYMQANPIPPPDGTYDILMERIGLPDRKFKPIWDEVIYALDAEAYRKRGPRGAHRRRRR